MMIVSFLFNVFCALITCDSESSHPIENPISKLNRESKELKSLNPIVETRHGAIEGFIMHTMSSRKIFAFTGLRYAAPPKRFEAPVPYEEKWSGVRKANQPSPYCLQMHVVSLFRVKGVEDCLYLNVYTPKIPIISKEKSQRQLPVLIWIHGGCFLLGGGKEYGPAYILEKDVILVTINYRLGVLGFMSTGDELSRGNYGLKDQAMAIEWVKNNIHSFGGNGSDITLFGQSAGAASAHFQHLSPRSSGNFQRGYSMSASAFNHWSIQDGKTALNWTIKLAKRFNCPVGDNLKMVECLKSQNPYLLVGQQMQLFDWIPLPPILFGPVIEPQGKEAFMDKSPEQYYKLNQVGEKPWVFSMTVDEGYTELLFLHALNRLNRVSSVYHWDLFSPIYLDYLNVVKDKEKRTEITNKIWDFYIKDNIKNLDIFSRIPNQILADMSTDRYFSQAARKAIQTHSYYFPNKTYAYLFDHKGSFTLGNLYGIPTVEWGVGHTEDVLYLLNSTVYFRSFMENSADFNASKRMVNMLVNYATNGIPSFESSENKIKSFWPPVQSHDVQFLQISNEKMIPQPFLKRIQFWETLQLPDVIPFKI